MLERSVCNLYCRPASSATLRLRLPCPLPARPPACPAATLSVQAVLARAGYDVLDNPVESHCWWHASSWQTGLFVDDALALVLKYFVTNEHAKSKDEFLEIYDAIQHRASDHFGSGVLAPSTHEWAALSARACWLCLCVLAGTASSVY